MAATYDPAVAIYLSQASALSKRVLAKVSEVSAVSGWALSKSLDTNPDEIEPVLSQLREHNLLASDEPGLEGMYYLTRLGYLSQDMF